MVGANRPDHHQKNVNYPRDFTVDTVLEIAMAEAGQGCPVCGTPLEAVRGIEVGHVFKLGERPVIMGCYGIGVGRLLAAAIEQNHDDKGIIFPSPIAPFQVHLVALNPQEAEVSAAADRLYADCTAQGYEVLYDDRAETAGVKFNDADLLGLPVRLVVSPRNLKQQAVEVKQRSEAEGALVPLGELTATLEKLLGRPGAG